MSQFLKHSKEQYAGYLRKLEILNEMSRQS